MNAKMPKNKNISFQEFTEKFFLEMMKNTFHAEFIKWMSDKTKNLPNGTPVLLNMGRSKAYNPKVFRQELRKRMAGLRLTHIIFDDAKKE